MEPEDFLRPTGRLDETWIDTDALQALIDAAEAQSDNAAVVKATVYAQAYARLADDAAARPTTRVADDIRESYSPALVGHWLRQAAAWQDTANRLLGGATSAHRAVRGVW